MKRQDMTSERGESLVSYALLIGAIAMVAIGSLTQVGGSVDERFTETGDAFQAVDETTPTVAPGDDEESNGSDDGQPVVGGGATGGGGVGEGSGAGDTEGSDPTGEDETLPEDTDEGDQPDDEGSDGGSDGEPAGETGDPNEGGGDPDSPDPGTDPADGDDGDDGDDGGDGTGGDATNEVSESVGLFGEFTVEFKVVDGKVVIGSVASPGWKYEVRKDNGKEIEMRFTNNEKGKNKKTVTVKAWISKDGKLETSVK